MTTTDGNMSQLLELTGSNTPCLSFKYCMGNLWRENEGCEDVFSADITFPLWPAAC